MVGSFVNTMAFFFLILLVAAFFLCRAFKQLGKDEPETQARIKKDMVEAATLLVQRFAGK